MGGLDQRWLYSDVAWGVTLCAARCGKVAEVLADGVPLCVDHADLDLGRTIAVEIWPALRETLGDWRQRG